MRRRRNFEGLKTYFVVVWCALVAHTIQGFGLIWFPDAVNPIDVSAIIRMVPLDWAPVCLFVASGLAFVGIQKGLNLRWYGRLGCLIPQQALISLAVWGVMIAVSDGKYADGTVKSEIHIFVDQLWLVMYFVVHGYAITRWASV